MMMMRATSRISGALKDDHDEELVCSKHLALIFLGASHIGENVAPHGLG